MLFSFGIGSAGQGAPSYSVRLPFVMAPGRTFKLADGGRFDLLGHPCEMTQEHNQYALTVSGFDSEDAASTFLLKACAGLIWFGLKHAVGFRFNADTTPVELFPQPRPIAKGSHFDSITAPKGWPEIDGQYDADNTIIRPEHKRLIVWATGYATVRLDTPVALLSQVMLEAMAEGRPERVLRHSKLRLACEVYLSSHFESTPAASFLSHITTLEILVTDTPASTPARAMVERFIAEARKTQNAENDPALKREFESLASRLAYLRCRSIKSGICRIVEDKLRTDSDIGAPAEVAREVSLLYDLRSTLVHSGGADPATVRAASGRLNEVVPRVLKAMFRETAQGE
jgi:hypothetical protein